LRRGLRRFWLLVSAVAMVTPAVQVGLRAVQRGRVNELTLAGLRPGRDTIEKPQHQYKESLRRGVLGDPNLFQVEDYCNRKMLAINEGASGTIDSIVVGPTIGAVNADCSPGSYFPRAKNHWRTGHNLGVGSSCDSIEQIYGKAESRSPSVAGGDKLELYLYKFDWAGTDVPQVMEVSCDISSQTVAEITLAAATL
jgi:hypothetical protein